MAASKPGAGGRFGGGNGWNCDGSDCWSEYFPGGGGEPDVCGVAYEGCSGAQCCAVPSGWHGGRYRAAVFAVGYNSSYRPNHVSGGTESGGYGGGGANPQGGGGGYGGGESGGITSTYGRRSGGGGGGGTVRGMETPKGGKSGIRDGNGMVVIVKQ